MIPTGKVYCKEVYGMNDRCTLAARSLSLSHEEEVGQSANMRQSQCLGEPDCPMACLPNSHTTALGLAPLAQATLAFKTIKRFDCVNSFSRKLRDVALRTAPPRHRFAAAD